MTSTTAAALLVCREGRAAWRVRAERAESAVRRDAETLRARTATAAIDVRPAPAPETDALASPVLWLAIGLALLAGAAGGLVLGLRVR